MYINPECTAGVYLCSPTNSTMFTECCDVAICDSEGSCPKCGREIIGHAEEADHKTHKTRWNYAYKRFK